MAATWGLYDGNVSTENNGGFIQIRMSLDKIKLEYPDVIVVDPTEEIYTHEKEINFLDNIHLTPHGNEIIANNIMFSIVNDVKVLTIP